MKGKPVRLVLLCIEGDSSRWIADALRKEFGVLTVIQEGKNSRWLLLKRRASRLGWTICVGQVLFQALALPLLRWESRRRRSELLHGSNAIPLAADYRVSSANSAEAHELLKALRPTVVIVNGTRILSQATLDSTPASFVNMHAGITPRYRGVHGGYWALTEGSRDVGTTVHLVDSGIDTGQILEQVRFQVAPDDNFASYPVLHTLHGIPALLRQVRNLLDGVARAKAPKGNGPSRLWSHPTLWGYVSLRWTRGVR